MLKPFFLCALQEAYFATAIYKFKILIFDVRYYNEYVHYLKIQYQ